jgi:indoleamine 2,3-dioxygenase
MNSQRLIQHFGVSDSTGFLPHASPLRQLSDAYYAPWENAITALPERIASGTVHATVEALPILQTAQLRSERQWQRAYVVLAFLTQAYVWSGKQPRQVGVVFTSYIQF